MVLKVISGEHIPFLLVMSEGEIPLRLPKGTSASRLFVANKQPRALGPNVIQKKETHIYRQKQR